MWNSADLTGRQWPGSQGSPRFSLPVCEMGTNHSSKVVVRIPHQRPGFSEEAVVILLLWAVRCGALESDLLVSKNAGQGPCESTVSYGCGVVPAGMEIAVPVRRIQWSHLGGDASERPPDSLTGGGRKVLEGILWKMGQTLLVTCLNSSLCQEPCRAPPVLL